MASDSRRLQSFGIRVTRPQVLRVLLLGVRAAEPVAVDRASLLDHLHHAPPRSLLNGVVRSLLPILLAVSIR